MSRGHVHLGQDDAVAHMAESHPRQGARCQDEGMARPGAQAGSVAERHPVLHVG